MNVRAFFAFDFTVHDIKTTDYDEKTTDYDMFNTKREKTDILNEVGIIIMIGGKCWYLICLTKRMKCVYVLKDIFWRWVTRLKISGVLMKGTCRDFQERRKRNI